MDDEVSLPAQYRRTVAIPADGVELGAAFEAPAGPRALVLLAHASGSARTSPRHRFLAIALRSAGFATLLVDLLTEREDLAGEARLDVALLSERLQTSVRWAWGHPLAANLPLGLFCAGTGAAAALEVAGALGKRIGAVVVRGGRPQLASPLALARVKAPTLLIVGGEDAGLFDPNESAYERLACVKEMAIVPGATHLFEEPGTLEQVAGLAADWFQRHLGAGPGARRPPSRRALHSGERIG